jgi:hypothetical protein
MILNVISFISVFISVMSEMSAVSSIQSGHACRFCRFMSLMSLLNKNDKFNRFERAAYQFMYNVVQMCLYYSICCLLLSFRPTAMECVEAFLDILPFVIRFPQRISVARR